MRRSNCSDPIPPGTPGQPRGHYFFFGCPGPLITIFLPSCPALFITHIFHLTLGLPGGGDGGRTIWPAHYSTTTFPLHTSWLLQLLHGFKSFRWKIFQKDKDSDFSQIDQQFAMFSLCLPFRVIYKADHRSYDRANQKRPINHYLRVF